MKRADRLVEMGRNPPQKRLKLFEQFRRNCGIIKRRKIFGTSKVL